MRAICVYRKQLIFSEIRFIFAYIRELSSIRREGYPGINIPDYDLWRAAQHRRTIKAELTACRVRSLAKLQVVAVWRKREVFEIIVGWRDNRCVAVGRHVTERKALLALIFQFKEKILAVG